MEQNIVIYIGLYKALGIIGSAIVSIAYGSWAAATRLSKVETEIEAFESRLTNVEGRLDGAFSSRSPLALLPRGQAVLEESGLKKYIEEHKEDLLRRCRAENAMSVPYDIQESAFRFFTTHRFGGYEEVLKGSAFRHGISMNAIRRIAGIYFRDICLEASGYKREATTRTASRSIKWLSWDF